MKYAGTLRRRAFLKSVALAAAPLIVPTGAFGRAGQPGANGKVITGHIGLGPRGRYLLGQLQDHAVAVCDVEDTRLYAGAALTNAGTKTYTEYRELLARKDIDAVVIATPDHWHAVQAVHACEAGKDVYLETPVCRSPIAGRALVRAAARFGTVVQTGTTAHYAPAYAAMKAALGELGAVNEVACWGAPNPPGEIEVPEPPPASIRWDTWLGPAPLHPYAKAFFEDGWRWRLDFGGGQIMRQGAQLFECALAALGCTLDTNIKISSTGSTPAGAVSDCPQPFDAVIELEKPAMKFTWSQPPDDGGPRLELRGANGTVGMRGLDVETTVEAGVLAKLPEEERKAKPDPLAAWLNAIDTRTKPDAALSQGVLAATMAALANVSFRLGRPIAWDAATGICVGDDVANRMIAEPGAGPWRI